MSSSESSSQTGPTLLWVIGCFAGFAALFYLIQALFGGAAADADPRAGERLAARQEVAKEQAEMIGKMGLDDQAKRAAVFAKTAAGLKTKKAAKSEALVPGSPTQLKQMEAEAAAAAAQAPAAAGDKPAEGGDKPAEPAPAPAPAPSGNTPPN